MMVCFRLDRAADLSAITFFERVRQKCDEPFNLFKSPFNKNRIWFDQAVGLGVFNLEISWPPLYLIGFLGIAASWYFHLRPGWFILPVIMSSLVLFWIPAFYILMFRLGLKKAGYKGKVKRIGLADVLVEILWDK